MDSKDKALEAREARKVQAKKDGRVNNATLYAGSPMYFYCIHCGLESEVCPEGYTWKPMRICGSCQTMEEKGWLE